MLAGLLAALGAGLLWGLVFVVPLMLGEYPGIVLALLTALGFALWQAVTTAPGDAFEWPLGPRPLPFAGLMLLVGLAASWLGTLLWNRASHLLPAALAGQLIVFETLAALLYAFLWYARWPSASEAVGIVLLVCGVLLGVRVFRGPPAANG